jgi:hypothetical protein
VLLNRIVLNARVPLHGISKIQTRARRNGVARPADKIKGAYVQQRLVGATLLEMPGVYPDVMTG